MLFNGTWAKVGYEKKKKTHMFCLVSREISS
jgi:hypothetical protein